MHFTEIQKRIENAQDLDFGTLFNKAIELFKKVWVQGLVTVLLNMVMAIPVIMLVYIPLFFIGIFDLYATSYSDFDSYDAYGGSSFNPILLLVVIPLYLFAVVALSTISFGLRSAFYRICKMKDLGEIAKEEYFYFFKKPYLIKTIKLSLAAIGIAIIASLFCFLPLFYVVVPIFYMYIVYAFNPEKSVSEIVKLSFAIGNKKWLLSFGLLLVSGLLATFLGFLMCFIGTYFTQSFILLPSYHIYKDVVGFEDTNGMQDVEEVIF